MGLIRPTAGTAELLGHDIVLEGSLARRHVGFLPERNFLFLHYSAWAFLNYMARLLGVPKPDRSSRIKGVLKFVGLDEKWWKKPSRTYSEGMRQRVGLAGTMLNPYNELLLLDEPTSSLDPLGRQDFLEKIKDLKATQGLNVLISSHVLSEIEQICENVIIIHQGQIITSGTIPELSNLFMRGHFKLQFSDNDLFLRELKKEMSFDLLKEGSHLLIKVNDSKALRSSINQIINRTQLELLFFEEAKMDLNEIFRKILKKDKLKDES